MARRTILCVVVLPLLAGAGMLGCPTPNPIGGPVLNVVASAFSFASDEDTATMTVRNVGTGALTWTVALTPAWLTATPSSGVGDGTVTLTVDRSALAPGTYTDDFLVASSGGTVTVTVTIVVTGPPTPPTIVLDPTTLDFGETTTDLTFTVSNSGSGTLNWTAAADQPWVTGIVPASGATVSGAPETVTVTVDRTGLAPGPGYTSIITVTNTDTSDTETVTATLDVAGPAPELFVTPLTLDYGFTTSDHNFTVANIGTAPLNWSLADDMPWLATTLTNGTLAAGAQVVVMATVTRDGSTPPASSPFTGTITVTDTTTSTSIDVAVIMEVAASEFIVTPLVLNFGSTALTKLVAVQNPGLDLINWNIDTSALPAWLEDDFGVPLISPTSGSVQSSIQGITVSVNRSPAGGPLLAPGDYTGQFTITTVPDYGTFTITVNMSVAAVPVLVVETGSVGLDPPVVNFDNDQDLSSFTVANGGTGTLNWEIDDSAFPEWLAIAPLTGALTTNMDTVAVAIDRTGLETTSYSHEFLITSNGGQQFVEVTMVVPPRPIIGVDPSAIDFGTMDDTSNFWVANLGDVGTTLNFVVESDRPGWLFASPENGSSAGVAGTWVDKDWQRINVSIDRGGFTGSGPSGSFTIKAIDAAGEVIATEVIEWKEVRVSAVAAPLAFESTVARKRTPSIVRFHFICRDIGDLAFQIAPDAPFLTDDPLQGPFTIYEKDVPIEEPAETNVVLLAQNSLLSQGLTDYRADIKMNVVLLLDYSGSMEASADALGRTIQDIYEEVGDIYIDRFFANFPNTEPGMVRMAIMEYHERNIAPTLQQDFTDDPAALKAAIAAINITDNGASELLPAVESATFTLLAEDDNMIPYDNADVRIVALLSDGRMTTPPGETSDTLELLEIAKTRTYNTGWGLALNSEPLARLGSESGGHYYPTALDPNTDMPVVANFITRLEQCADDLASHMVLSYVALNEEESTTVRFDGSFRRFPATDPLEGSLVEQNLNLLEIVGDTRLGQVSMRCPGASVGNPAEVILRAEYVPRSINKFQFALAASEVFTVPPAAVTLAEGGLVSGWTLTNPVPGVVWRLEAPSGEYLPYGSFGDLLRLNIANVTVLPLTVTLTVDNGIYAGDPEPKYFISPDAMDVDGPAFLAPAFPTPQLTPQFLDFGAGIDTLTFDIQNIGGSYDYGDGRIVQLLWYIAEEPSFASATPESGFLASTTVSQTISVTVDRRIDPGLYIDELGVGWGWVDGAGGGVSGLSEVLLRMQVLQAPVLFVDNTTLTILSGDNDASFRIYNTGTGTLTWGLDTTGTPLWITSILPPSGTTNAEADWVEVLVDRTGLPPGVSTGTFDVVSDGGTETITVNLTSP
ncbi:MAG: VWA domain-containing protein [bacterium]|nr:VWA domain-containing protein [bacterium]